MNDPQEPDPGPIVVFYAPGRSGSCTACGCVPRTPTAAVIELGRRHTTTVRLCKECQEDLTRQLAALP